MPASVLITGAAGGIGLHLARRYADAGARVFATGRQPIAVLASRNPDLDVTWIEADQADPFAAAQAIGATIDAAGCHCLDAAILNAATGWSGDPAGESPETVALQVRANLTAPILIARALAPLLLENLGTLSLIGSVARKGTPEFATYAATKAGLHGFARSLREEWRGRAHVQVLHPGPTATALQAKAGFDDAKVRRFFIRPETMANAIFRAVEKRSRSRTLGHLHCAAVALTG